jgi:hypothetical protein
VCTLILPALLWRRGGDRFIRAPRTEIKMYIAAPPR